MPGQRPADRPAPDQRGDRRNWASQASQRFLDLANGEDRPDRDERVRWRDHDRPGSPQRLEDARGGDGRRRALVAHAAHRVGMTPADEPGLEVELSDVGLDERPQPVVGRRK